MANAPIGFTLIMRIEMPNTAGAFGLLASAIGDAGGIVGAVDMRSVTKQFVVRDVTVTVPNDQVGDAVREAILKIEGVRLVSSSDSWPFSNRP